MVDRLRGAPECAVRLLVDEGQAQLERQDRMRQFMGQLAKMKNAKVRVLTGRVKGKKGNMHLKTIGAIAFIPRRVTSVTMSYSPLAPPGLPMQRLAGVSH